MALKKYSPKLAPVLDESGEEVATVHGISFAAIVELININRPAVEALFEQFSGRDPTTVTEDDFAGLGMQMIQSAPNLVAQIIATASDAYDDWERGETSPIEVIMDWPVGLQWAALEQIAPLTFKAGGGAKKMLALALQVARSQSPSRQP